MAEFKAHKIVGSLPDPLEPDTLYFIRAGTGFDLYLSDDTGNVAHRVNRQGLRFRTELVDQYSFPPYSPDGIHYEAGDVTWLYTENEYLGVEQYFLAFFDAPHHATSIQDIFNYSTTVIIDESRNLPPLSLWVNTAAGYPSAGVPVTINEFKTLLAHVISDIPGLQSALDGKLPASSVTPLALTLLDDTTQTAMRTTLGLGAGATWTAVPANHVTNTRAADMPTMTLKGNDGATTADPKDLTVAQVKTLLNYSWNDIGNKPETFAPSPHNHYKGVWETGVSYEIGDMVNFYDPALKEEGIGFAKIPHVSTEGNRPHWYNANEWSVAITRQWDELPAFSFYGNPYDYENIDKFPISVSEAKEMLALEISDMDGLQPALDAKQDAATALKATTLTQAQYDALGTKDPNTIYIISG